MYKNRITIYESVKNKEIDRKYCVYWMQQSQRTSYNHCLEYAIELANRYDLEVLVYFGITTSYPEANMRHYGFMMEGLKEVIKDLDSRHIGWCFANESPELGIDDLLKLTQILVLDKGYLSFQKQWRQEVVQKARRVKIAGIYEVESDLIVPVKTASIKEEYAARTIRPKIMSKLEEYAIPVLKNKVKHPYNPSSEIRELYPLFKGEEAFNWKEFLEASPIDKSVPMSQVYSGGYSQAIKHLTEFLEYGLNAYDESNNPAVDLTSKMSLYLHFGQISALEIYMYIQEYASINSLNRGGVDGYIEQLCVRRELAYNYCYYHEGYDVFKKMTYPWAYQTMKVHEWDHRPILYTLEELEAYKTHDIYWNAAMKEMVITGYMHNYMRMYWCKKILEWSPSHEIAYKWSIYLNNKYFIDGRDPNSFVGVAWCFGLHDHGWKEREIFGKLRYMNDKGLKRKFDMEAYISRVNILTQTGQEQLELNNKVILGRYGDYKE